MGLLGCNTAWSGSKNVENKIFGSKFYLSTPVVFSTVQGYAHQIEVRLKTTFVGSSALVVAKAAIYDASSNVFLGSTNPRTFSHTNESWERFYLTTGVPIKNFKSYYLCFWAQNSSDGIYIKTQASNGHGTFEQNRTFGNYSWPNTVATSTADSDAVGSIYCTYHF